MQSPIGGDSERVSFQNEWNGKYVGIVKLAKYIIKNDRQMLKINLDIDGNNCSLETLWVFNKGKTDSGYNKALDFMGILGIKQGEPMRADEDKEGHYHIDKAIDKKIGVVLQTYKRYESQPINGYTKQLDMNRTPELVYIPDYSQDIKCRVYVNKFFNADTKQTYLEMQQGLQPEAVDKTNIMVKPEEKQMPIEELNKFVMDKLKQQLAQKNIPFDSKRWVSFENSVAMGDANVTYNAPIEPTKKEVDNNAETNYTEQTNEDDDEMPF